MASIILQMCLPFSGKPLIKKKLHLIFCHFFSIVSAFPPPPPLCDKIYATCMLLQRANSCWPPVHTRVNHWLFVFKTHTHMTKFSYQNGWLPRITGLASIWFQMNIIAIRGFKTIEMQMQIRKLIFLNTYWDIVSPNFARLSCGFIAQNSKRGGISSGFIKSIKIKRWCTSTSAWLLGTGRYWYCGASSLSCCFSGEWDTLFFTSPQHGRVGRQRTTCQIIMIELYCASWNWNREI